MEEGRERGTIPEASTGDGETMVALARVIAQRTALAEFYAVALLQPSLETLLVEAARVAAKGCDAPQAKVLERDAQSAQFRLLAAWNLKEGYVGRLVGSIAADNPPGQCLAERRAVVVPDLRAHPDYHLPEIFGAHGVVASANVPIIGSRGAFGVLEIDVPAPRAFDALDLSYLAAVAGLVGEAVERVRHEAALRTELDARGVLLREQQHRVRNHLQTLQILLHRHARAAPSEEVKPAFAEIERRIFALASLYDHLLGIGLGETVDLGTYLSELCEGICRFYEPEARGIALRSGPHSGRASVDLDAATALGTVLAELIANALEHAFADAGGTIRVALVAEGGETLLTVADDGSGFIAKDGASMGLEMARRLLERIGGALTRDTAAPGGTFWRIALPRG